VTAPAACPLPGNSLLHASVGAGAYADCYCVDVDRPVSLAQFVAAFYTTGVFRIERALLKVLLSRPSTDEEAAQLGGGMRDSFAVWKVEQRSADQLLMAATVGRTKSWFMVADGGSGSTPGTRLYFGSAVMPKPGAPRGQRRFGALFGGLLWFHQLYSRALLAAARGRLSAKAAG
jgi:hypothetical protein